MAWAKKDDEKAWSGMDGLETGLLLLSLLENRAAYVYGAVG